MKRKDYYVYLFTRSIKSKQSGGVFQEINLRVKAIAYGRALTTTLPLKVRADFSNYYNSDGTLREELKAVTRREKFERDKVLLAYKAVCNVAKYMLSISRDYWLLSPSANFSELVNHEFYNLCEGLTSWVEQFKENNAQRKKNGLTNTPITRMSNEKDTCENTTSKEKLNVPDIMKDNVEIVSDTASLNYSEKTPIWETDGDFLSPYEDFSPIQTWCKMGERPALPKEGIVTFSAKQKGDKSLSTYALAIPLLSGKPFDTITPTGQPNLIMVFDMENSKTTLINRLLREVQSIGECGDNTFVVCSLKAKSIPERLRTIAEKVEKYNPDIVVIDQVVKLVANINAMDEVSAVVDFLDKLSIGRSVWAVMHKNKTDANMRGFLGQNLSFAAVESYSIENEDEIFTVTLKEARESDAKNAKSVKFMLGENKQITEVNESVKDPQQNKFVKCYEYFASIFGTDDKLRAEELANRICIKEHISKEAARMRIQSAKKNGIICKSNHHRMSPYKLISI